jgi:hypothetical protein
MNYLIASTQVIGRFLGFVVGYNFEMPSQDALKRYPVLRYYF